MAGEIDIDEIPRLHLRCQIGKGCTDRAQRRNRRALDRVLQDRHVFRREGHRGPAGQIGGHQLYIVAGAFQPSAFGRVLIPVHPDQQRMVLSRQGRQGGKAKAREVNYLSHQLVINA